MSDSRKTDGNITELRPGDLETTPAGTKIPPDHILTNNLGRFDEVVIIGRLKEDLQIVICCSDGVADCNWLLDRAKFLLHS